jgi:hypothetical protein
LDTRPNAITFDLEDLVDKAWRGQIRIPHFQRPFRWGREDVRRLFDSVVRGYPIGSVLLWLRPAPEQELVLGRLHIPAPAMERAWWVVDGQQRITSLANALHLDADRDAQFSLGYDLAAERFVTPGSGSDRTVPLPVLFDLVKLIRWFDERPELKSHLDAASAVAKAIRQYKVPAYQVEQDNVEVLQDIFDRLNNYGKRLSKAEIFTALNAGAEEGETDQLSIELIAENIDAEQAFGVLDGDTVLKAILARRNPDVLRDIRNEFDGRTGIEFPDEDRDTAYELAQVALRAAVTFLQEQASVPHLALLPFRNLLVVLTRFFAHHPDPGEHNLRLLRRWFWRAAVIGPEGFTGGTTGALRALCAAVVPGDLTGSIQNLLRLVSEGRQILPDVRNFRTNQSRTKILLCAMWAAGPRSPITFAAYDQADLAEALTDQSTAADAVREIIPRRDLPAELRPAAGNRLLAPGLVSSDIIWLLMNRSADSNTERAAVLDSHAITNEMVSLLTHGAHGRFIEVRNDELRDRVVKFLNRRCEWDFEDTPALAELDLDDDSDLGDDDFPA